MIILLFLAAGIFFYILIHKPEYIAVLLFTFIIANINIDLNGLPLNTKALITLLLFGRVLFDNKTIKSYPSFWGISNVKVFIFFFAYILLVSFWQDLFSLDFLKGSISTIISVFLVYHFFFKSGSLRELKMAMILSGLICFVDLAYTYVVFGSFPMQRLYFLFTSNNPVSEMDPDDLFNSTINHNFFGQVCGMCFVFIFIDYIKNKIENKYILILLPLMFLGVLMSTSRSALLGVIVISFLVILNSVKLNEERKRVIKLMTYALAIVVIGTLLFGTFSAFVKIDSKFLEQVTFRLVDEPYAVIQKALGRNYNIQNLDAMDWREEAASSAFGSYMNFSFTEQLFGIGRNGFVVRNLGHGLNPHNGILLILIENGLFGLSIYTLIIFNAIWMSIKINKLSPSLATVGFIIIYAIGQNGELTQTTTFLFVYGIISEIQHFNLVKHINDIEKRTSLKMRLRKVVT